MLRTSSIAIGTAMLLTAGGCGSNTTGVSAVQVASGECQFGGAAGQRVTSSCDFVLSDGKRFKCARQLTGSNGVALRAAGCVGLHALKLTTAQRSIGDEIARARACLAREGIRASGGAVLPNAPGVVSNAGSGSPDGELVISAHDPAFVAYYGSVTKARRLQGAVIGNARRVGGEVERHGAITILWTAVPPTRELAVVQSCVLR
jgi:hypothetical protein